MPTTLAGFLAASNHTSYPPGHPGTPPPGVTAVTCYQTALEAASAGRAADRLGFAVPCPGLLPPASAGDSSGSSGTGSRSRSGTVAQPTTAPWT
jgi:hypothetical protein